METCFLCKRVCRLETHHIFPGVGLRKKSDRYGLVVRICPECHREVHREWTKRLELKQYGQRKAMEENGWTISDFIREFGRNYLEVED